MTESLQIESLIIDGALVKLPHYLATASEMEAMSVHVMEYKYHEVIAAMEQSLTSHREISESFTKLNKELQKSQEEFQLSQEELQKSQEGYQQVREDLSKTEQELKQTKSALRQSHEENNKLKKMELNLKSELQDVYTSTSWRSTAFLRKLRLFFKPVD